MTPFDLDEIRDRTLSVLADAEVCDEARQVARDSLRLTGEVDRLQRVLLHLGNVLGDLYDRDAGRLIREAVRAA